MGVGGATAVNCIGREKRLFKREVWWSRNDGVGEI